jgi:CelD/BcsL family acetyltransferase involved in cellulose biosynthesis
MVCSTDIQVSHDLTSIIPQWRHLLANCPDSTPFQSPAWLLPWWQVFGEGEPIIVSVLNRGGLAGLGLFYVYKGDPDRGPQLFFLGKSVSDYLDLLVAPNQPRAQVAQLIFNAVLESASWQHADLDRLRSTSSVLEVCPPAGISESRFQEGVCPELPLQGSTIKQIASKNTRDSIRKHLNRARSVGEIEFVSAEQHSFPSLIRTLVHLHSARWNQAGLPGVFADARMIRFLTDAGMQLLEHGELQFIAMLLDGLPIAIAFAILHHERNYFYLCDFDPAYASISPGTLVTAYAMEQAAQRGAKYFDFLQGDERYKFVKWGAHPRFTYRIRYSR